MFRTATPNFDKLLDKATSNLLLDPDWPSILQICDLIRQNDCTPKNAIAAIKKKLYSQNPHQAMFALLVLESIVKNCGSGVHDEISIKANCEMFREFIKSTQHENVRNKMLELIQAWAFAFRNNPKYRAVQDTVNIMKTEGYKFPPLKESDAMFSADTAPVWSDGDVCHRCRVAFTMMQRKHHCRACGQVFCQQCSSKSTTLPKFGIEKEVRVCDACFDLVNRPPGPQKATDETATEFESMISQVKNPPKKTAEELQEEEELQLAIALSQSEAEQKEKEKEKKSRIQPAAAPVRAPTPPSPPVSTAPSTQMGELSRYLDRDFWERRASSLASSNATAAADTSGVLRASPPLTKATNVPTAGPTTNNNSNKTGALQLDDAFAETELEEFVAALKSQVEIFVNRMKSNSSRGRSIANDTSVQTLFMNITAMHSRLLRYIQQQDDARVHFENLQDKLSQVRDSRAALDVLREEHAERVRRAAEAAERQRQMQMMHKLDVMRKKKHEYLQYQRQLALQRIQEQERELQMRQEQQKHQYMMGANAPFFTKSSPVHQYHAVQAGYPISQFPGQHFSPQQVITPPSTNANGSMAHSNIAGRQQNQATPQQSMGLHGPQAGQQIGSQVANQPQGNSIGAELGAHQPQLNPSSVRLLMSNVGLSSMLPNGMRRPSDSQIIQDIINQSNQTINPLQNRIRGAHPGQQQSVQMQPRQQHISQMPPQQIQQQQLPQQRQQIRQQMAQQQQQILQQQQMSHQHITQHQVPSQRSVPMQHAIQQLPKHPEALLQQPHPCPQQIHPSQETQASLHRAQIPYQYGLQQQMPPQGQQAPQQQVTRQPQQQAAHLPQQQATHPPQQQATHPPQQQATHPPQQQATRLPQQQMPQQEQASNRQPNSVQPSQNTDLQNSAQNQQTAHIGAPEATPGSPRADAAPPAAPGLQSSEQPSSPKNATAELISFD